MNKRHHKESFIETFDEYGDAIFRFCMVKTGNKELSEDLTQETFMRFWQSLRDGKEMTNTRAYLYRIAGNLVIDWYRKKKEDSLDARLEAGFDPIDTHAESPGAEAEYAEIFDAIGKLETRDREIVLLRYVEGYEPREIAEMLDLNANAVSVRLNRAIKRLQRHLKI